MPCPHNEITIVQRSQRQSAVAAAAYQSGEKLFCEYDQQVKHYPEKRGIPTAITQNIKDLLASREVENIFENSDFVLMLNQAQGDRAILAKQLNISPQQMKYVTHTEAGEGLIFYGNVVLPFIDRFPTDTELYRLLTTKPEEVSKP